jgi:hypothetical protein
VIADCDRPSQGTARGPPPSGAGIRIGGVVRCRRITGQPHSAMIATENVALVIYSGETDDVKSVEIVDIEPALGEVA